MTEWLAPIGSGLIAGLIGAWTTYLFSLRRDKEERRRERLVAHLIEAYRNLEDASLRETLSEDRKQRLESSLASIFLLGSREAAKEAELAAEGIASGTGDVTRLLRVLRNDLRRELGLEAHDVNLKFLRFDVDEKTSA